MYLNKTICRACGNDELLPVFDLGLQHLANDFKKQSDAHNGAYPLKVMLCPSCTLAQLSAVVDPRVLYSNYCYTTSKSQMMKDHFTALWSEIQKETNSQNMLEIGSNDGDFLMHCASNHKGGPSIVIGIEPAANLAAIANDRGIKTHCGVFGTGEWKVESSTKPGIIVARHVFAHVDNWHLFMKDIDQVCGEDGLVVIEVPYVLDTLKKVEFDQVYSEHTSFLSIRAMEALLQDTPFHIHNVIQFPIHGGAIAIFLRRRSSLIEPKPIVNQMIEAETFGIRDWQQFESEARRRIVRLREIVMIRKARGAKVCGFGASAKSTVWIQACGFTKKDIDFICDSTPQKQGTLSPGNDIPIVPESHLTRETADVAICFAWNFWDAVQAKLQPWIDAGGQLLNPHDLSVAEANKPVNLAFTDN